jgi:hypothetical protein
MAWPVSQQLLISGELDRVMVAEMLANQGRTVSAQGDNPLLIQFTERFFKQLIDMVQQ